MNVKIAFDCKLGRPACVLLQAVWGGDRNAVSRFNSESWLVAPTPDMAMYEIPPDVFEKLVVKVNAGHRAGWRKQVP